MPFEQGEVLGELYALGSPIEREDEAEGVRIRAHLPRGWPSATPRSGSPDQARDAAGGA